MEVMESSHEAQGLLAGFYNLHSFISCFQLFCPNPKSCGAWG